MDDFRIYLDGVRFYPPTRHDFEELLDLATRAEKLRNKDYNQVTVARGISSHIHPDGARSIRWKTNSGREVIVEYPTPDGTYHEHD